MAGYVLIEQTQLAIAKEDGITPYPEVFGFLNFLRELAQDELYRRALVDRDYRRTEREIVEAIEKARQASEALRSLTQDLEAFNLQHYRKLRGHFTLNDLRLFVRCGSRRS